MSAQPQKQHTQKEEEQVPEMTLFLDEEKVIYRLTDEVKHVFHRIETLSEAIDERRYVLNMPLISATKFRTLIDAMKEVESILSHPKFWPVCASIGDDAIHAYGIEKYEFDEKKVTLPSYATQMKHRAQKHLEDRIAAWNNENKTRAEKKEPLVQHLDLVFPYSETDLRVFLRHEQFSKPSDFLQLPAAVKNEKMISEIQIYLEFS